MYSLSKKILVFCIIIHSMAQASLIQCYSCVSSTDGDCYKKPHNALQIDCVPEMKYKLEKQYMLKWAKMGIELSRYVLPANYTSISYYWPYDECWKIEGNVQKMEGVMRMCGSSYFSDEFIKNIRNLRSSTGIYAVHRCNTDLCNCSSKLSIRLWTLISCLIPLLLFR